MASSIEPTNKEPRIGPVHENETNARVNAIKKMPIIPPRVALESTLFAQLCGKTISKAPKNDIANTTSSKKKTILNRENAVTNANDQKQTLDPNKSDVLNSNNKNRVQ